MKTLILTIVFMIVMPRFALADFYMFVDKGGVVHFTNVPTSKKFKWVMPEEESVRSAFDSLDGIITNASTRWGIDPWLVKAVIKAESDFDPRAVSRAGAKGLMQLMPETARLMGVQDIYDPAENVEAGVKYLRRLLKRFDWDVSLALAAYNAGESVVRKYGGIPPFEETRRYVSKVLSYRSIYNGTASQ